MLNYTFGGARGKNLANGVIVPLCDLAASTCASGASPTSPTRDIRVTFHAGSSAVTTYFLADVLGYFGPADPGVSCGSGTTFIELAATECPPWASWGLPDCSRVTVGNICEYDSGCTGGTVLQNDATTPSSFNNSLNNCNGATDWYIRTN